VLYEYYAEDGIFDGDEPLVFIEVGIQSRPGNECSKMLVGRGPLRCFNLPLGQSGGLKALWKLDRMGRLDGWLTDLI